MLTNNRIMKVIIYVAFATFLLTIPLFVKSVYFLHILIMVGINVIAASSLGLIVQTGHISFAHPAFMAIGAYTSTLLVTKIGLSYWLALPLAAITAGLVAFLIGYPILRMKGAYFFLVTFAFLEFIRLIFNYFRNPFGGSRGIIRIPQPIFDLPGLPKIEFTPSGSSYYYLILFLTAVTLFVLYRMEESRYGRIFKAIEQNDILAESLGVTIMKYNLLAFIVGCFFAGVAGAFTAPFLTFISPHLFSLHVAIFLIIYVIVGGIGSITGAVVGAVVLTVIPEFLRATGYYEMMLFAILLIVVTLFFPGGLISLPYRLRAWIAQRGS